MGIFFIEIGPQFGKLSEEIDPKVVKFEVWFRAVFLASICAIYGFKLF